jgi:hypothetical protein
MAKRLPPSRPRDKRRYRRDQEKFEFWRDSKGQWWGKSTRIKGAKKFKWTEPDFVGGQYKTPSGGWRKVNKAGKNVPSKTPTLFKKKPKLNRRRSTKNDANAIELIRAHLNNESFTSLWLVEMLPPIIPRTGRLRRKDEGGDRRPGVTQGYRTVARFRSTTPYTTTFSEMEQAVRAIGDDPTISKAFDGRPSAFALEFGTESDDSGEWNWISPALANSWNQTISQAEPFLSEQAMKYQPMLPSDTEDDDDEDEQPSFKIRQIQFSIE